MKIEIGTLNLTSGHINKVVEALKSGRLSYGPMTNEFENKFSKIHKNKYGIMTNSGTSALEAAIYALKILNNWKDGDEVIIPATTFVATYNVVLRNKLKPVLVDIDNNLNLDPDLIEDALTSRTVAIIPVHLLGKPANMQKITAVAKEFNLKIIEDSCESMFVKGIACGDVSCFSFYIAHLLVTGVGGMAITNDKRLSELIRSLIFHGRDSKYLTIDDDKIPTQEVIHSRFKFNYPGYSYRSTEMEAALGLIELNNKEMIKTRQNNSRYLYKQLKSSFLPKDYFNNHACMMFPYFSEKRDDLMFFLEKKGISTRTIMPLINQPYIKINPKDFPVSQKVLETGLLFGCHQDITQKQLDYIVESIKKHDTA